LPANHLPLIKKIILLFDSVSYLSSLVADAPILQRHCVIFQNNYSTMTGFETSVMAETNYSSWTGKK
jgi:hypothetical protein